MTFHREGILPFFCALALYGAYFSRPFARRTWERLKSRKEMLVRWREQTVDIRIPPRGVRPAFGEKQLSAAQEWFEKQSFEWAGDFYVKFQWPTTDSETSNAPLASPTEPGASSSLKPAALLSCRVLMHPQHQCVAYLVAFCPKPKKGAKTTTHFTYSIVSRAGDWSYTTSTARFFTAAQLLQLPHDLSTRLPMSFLKKKYPGKSLPVLLKYHLHHRQRIADKANLKWDAPPTMAQIVEYERVEVELLRAFARRHSPLSLDIHLKRLAKHSIQWEGDLKGQL